MKLYYFVGSCALADHIVLEWIGAPYEAQRMTHEDVKSPEFLAMNPNGTVPVLEDGDFVLSQNAAILTYLADLHPEAGLLGEGTPRGRAEVMRWLGYLNSDVHPAYKPIFLPGRYLPDSTQAEKIRETARGTVRKHLSHLNERLHGREWLADQRSIADAYLFVMLRWAVKLKIGLDAFPNLKRFSARMYDDPAVHRVLLAEEEAVAGDGP